MRVAIVHYHLRTGGVTRIIDNAVAALGPRGIRAAVVVGEVPSGKRPIPVAAVGSLAYDEEQPVHDPARLAADIEAAATEALNGRPDLWHFHNHSLGKNSALPVAVRLLAQSGHRILLQVHDFPEDGRPENYRRLLERVGEGSRKRLSDYLYPAAEQIHYAVLNGRDYRVLEAANLPHSRLHLLANPVWIGEGVTASDPPKADQRLWLYPTRAIRRKNLGEFVFWAALERGGDRFGVTRGPDNPAERPYYEQWVALADRLRLPVTFELGTSHQGDFASLLRTAYAMVTTSVAEGFGLAFLEPWLVGRPVTGRILPEITDEFEQAGVDLSGLYEGLPVPVEWVGRDVLSAAAGRALENVLGAYGQTPGPEDRERTLNAWIQDGKVDFGRLDEPLQALVVRRVAASAHAPGELDPECRLSFRDYPGERVEKNRAAIAEHFSLDKYAERLSEVYRRVAESSATQLDALDGERILDQFLAPERLWLLRS